LGAGARSGRLEEAIEQLLGREREDVGGKDDETMGELPQPRRVSRFPEKA